MENRWLFVIPIVRIHSRNYVHLGFKEFAVDLDVYFRVARRQSDQFVWYVRLNQYLHHSHLVRISGVTRNFNVFFRYGTSIRFFQKPHWSAEINEELNFLTHDPRSVFHNLLHSVFTTSHYRHIHINFSLLFHCYYLSVVNLFIQQFNCALSRVALFTRLLLVIINSIDSLLLICVQQILLVVILNQIGPFRCFELLVGPLRTQVYIFRLKLSGVTTLSTL